MHNHTGSRECPPLADADKAGQRRAGAQPMPAHHSGSTPFCQAECAGGPRRTAAIAALQTIAGVADSASVEAATNGSGASVLGTITEGCGHDTQRDVFNTWRFWSMCSPELTTVRCGSYHCNALHGAKCSARHGHVAGDKGHNAAAHAVLRCDSTPYELSGATTLVDAGKPHLRRHGNESLAVNAVLPGGLADA